MKKLLLSTNRVLIKVTLLEPFLDLKIKCFPECVSQSFEQFSSLDGYYLINDSRNELQPLLAHEEELKRQSEKIFMQELSEIGIPVKQWPNISSYEVFKEYITVEFFSLIADFGEGSIDNIKTVLE